MSNAPHLRTIVEQKSLEEREQEELQALPPSPTQSLIEDTVQRPQTWPLLGPMVPGLADNGPGRLLKSAVLCNGIQSNIVVCRCRCTCKLYFFKNEVYPARRRRHVLGIPRGVSGSVLLVYVDYRCVPGIFAVNSVTWCLT